MSILHKLVAKRLDNQDISQGQLVFDEEGISFSSDRLEIKLLCGELDQTFRNTYNLSQFNVYLCRARDHKQVQSRSIKLENERIGWVFPLNAILDNESRQKISDENSGKWTPVFSTFAVQALIFDHGVTELARIPALKENNEYSLLDFYPKDSAVVILSNQAIGNNISVESVQLLMIQHGYISYKPSDISGKLFGTGEFEGKVLKLDDISKDLSDYISRFEWILSRALQEESPCSCFHLLYQILETMITLVFKTSIRVYGQANALINDPWALRDKLVEIAKENWRLQTLFERFVKPSIDGSLVTDIKNKCLDFLLSNKLISENKTPKTASSALYLVRNVVIHRQIDLTEAAHFEIKEINNNFILLCYQLICKFNLETGEKNLNDALEMGDNSLDGDSEETGVLTQV